MKQFIPKTGPRHPPPTLAQAVARCECTKARIHLRLALLLPSILKRTGIFKGRA